MHPRSNHFSTKSTPSPSKKLANSDKNRSSWFSKAKSKKPKKKEESRIGEECQTKKRHHGYNTKKMTTTQGKIKLKRVYWECFPCGIPEHPADDVLGLTTGYIAGVRRLAVFAGTNWSFDKSAVHLKKFCGLSLSDNTIRKLCDQESPNMEAWQNNDTASHAPLIEAEGDAYRHLFETRIRKECDTSRTGDTALAEAACFDCVCRH